MPSGIGLLDPHRSLIHGSFCLYFILSKRFFMFCFFHDFSLNSFSVLTSQPDISMWLAIYFNYWWCISNSFPSRALKYLNPRDFWSVKCTCLLSKCLEANIVIHLKLTCMLQHSIFTIFWAKLQFETLIKYFLRFSNLMALKF